MQLAELVKDWPCRVKGSIRTSVKALAEHSRNVTSDTLFFAHRGKVVNGSRFIEAAIHNGATAIVTDDEQLFNNWTKRVTIIWVPNSRQFCAFASHRFYGEPSNIIPIIAITGTNGKTTTSHFIGQLARSLQVKTLVMGTNGIYVDGVKQSEDEPLTTKSSIFLQRQLQWAVRNQVELVVLEASSMGLEQHRLDYCAIDVGVYLNISQEHIEDHQTFDKYKMAKRRLLTLSEHVVSNADDLFCHAIAMKCTEPVMLFSLREQGDLNIQLLYEDLQHSIIKLTLGHYEEVCSVPFAGSYMLQNVAASISALCLLGVDIVDIIEQLQCLTLPDGRMQLIQLKHEVQLYIDYAHTPVALKNVLKHVEQHCKGNVIVVFSCGGERDRAKRQEMGRIASKYADYIILTTDNCRSEKPQSINEEIRSGFFATQQSVEILDRKAAIEHAIQKAQPRDVVLVVGKGHESVQIIGESVIEYNDFETVQALLAKKELSES